MSSRYKIHDHELPHFVTSTVTGWIDALSREVYKEIICDTLLYCTKEKGMNLHAWVIMSNHIHLVISASGGIMISDLMRDLKKFTSHKIIKAIAENQQESRREWMLNLFRYAGMNSNNEYQFWRPDYHPIALDREEKMRQKINYLHENPVRAGLVWEATHYKYSSATDYLGKSKGLLPIERLEI